jgi:CDP-diacylglycerol--glycerol-3-phosphate 3-phosphatidyltransferase
MKTRIWTVSNGLTSTRLVAAPFFYWAILDSAWGVAATLFWLAVVSDVIDGRVARARRETSVFGGVLDHGSDAIFVSLGHFALSQGGVTPDLLPFLILAAFIQYALDSRILSGQVLRASLIGRWNGVCYFIAPGIWVTREALDLSIPPDPWILAIGWLLVVSTVISMADRLVALVSTAWRRDRGSVPQSGDDI